MNGNKNLLAIFEKNASGSKEFELSLTVLGEGRINPNGGTFTDGEFIVFEILAEPGWAFKEWKGINGNDLFKVEDQWMLCMDGNKEIMAIFEKKQASYYLNINIEGEGRVEEQIINELDNANYYPGLSIIKLTAIAEDDWQFFKWQGALDDKKSVVYIELDENKDLDAIFIRKKQHSLSINIEGKGEVSKEPDLPNYKEGSLVTLTAKAAKGWEFQDWQGDASGSSLKTQIMMDSDKIALANFKKSSEREYKLKVEIVGSGQVKISPEEDSYLEGSQVTLTAQASPGWLFKDWQGDAEGRNSKIYLYMDEDKEVLAVFEENPENRYILLVNILGSGQVTRNPEADDYAEGTLVNLKARASSGWLFKGWQGDFTGSNAEIELVMDRDKEIIAVFEEEKKRYSLDVEIVGSGQVSKNPNSDDYAEGTTVTLTAKASSGWSFNGWQGDLSGSNPQAQIFMDGNKKVLASFEVNQGGQQYKLNVMILNGQGRVERQPDREEYPAGTRVILEAIGEGQCVFFHWIYENEIITESRIEVLMDKDKHYLVNFFVPGG